jgi:hypothetical protein
VRAREPHTGTRKAVNIGRFDDGVSRNAKRVVPPIIGVQNQDVRFYAALCLALYRRDEQEQQAKCQGSSCQHIDERGREITEHMNLTKQTKTQPLSGYSLRLFR